MKPLSIVGGESAFRRFDRFAAFDPHPFANDPFGEVHGFQGFAAQVRNAPRCTGSQTETAAIASNRPQRHAANPSQTASRNRAAWRSSELWRCRSAQ